MHYALDLVEIIQEILLYLNIFQLAQAKLVCRFWNQVIASSPVLLHKQFLKTDWSELKKYQKALKENYGKSYSGIFVHPSLANLRWNINKPLATATFASGSSISGQACLDALLTQPSMLSRSFDFFDAEFDEYLPGCNMEQRTHLTEPQLSWLSIRRGSQNAPKKAFMTVRMFLETIEATVGYVHRITAEFDREHPDYYTAQQLVMLLDNNIDHFVGVEWIYADPTSRNYSDQFGRFGVWVHRKFPETKETTEEEQKGADAAELVKYEVECIREEQEIDYNDRFGRY